MPQLTWKEKFQAINALDWEASLKMGSGGSWYVSAHVEIKDGSVLRGGGVHAPTPEEAIEEWWSEFVTDLNPESYIVANSASRENRAAFRWNGFMWDRVNEKVASNA
jgi:hypothetical protein